VDLDLRVALVTALRMSGNRPERRFDRAQRRPIIRCHRNRFEIAYFIEEIPRRIEDGRAASSASPSCPMKYQIKPISFSSERIAARLCRREIEYARLRHSIRNRPQR
jgi:hypothetical protein